MNNQNKRFYVILFATACWIIVMRLYSPSNIVEFEFAGTVQKANEIITAWGTEGVALATTSTWLDFIFLILYSAAISMGCRLASVFSKKDWLIKIGTWLSMIVWMAGVCDAIENIAMLQTLTSISQTTVSIAYYFAAVKFSIVLTGLLFIIVAALTGLVKKLA